MEMGRTEKFQQNPKEENIRRNTERWRENCIPPMRQQIGKQSWSPVIGRTDPQCARKSGMCEEHGCRLWCVMNQRRSLVVMLMSLYTVSGTVPDLMIFFRTGIPELPVRWCFDILLKGETARIGLHFTVLILTEQLPYHYSTSTVVMIRSAQRTESTMFVFEDLLYGTRNTVQVSIIFI